MRKTGKKDILHFFDNERVYAWISGTTSWSTDDDKEAMSWKYAKLAKV